MQPKPYSELSPQEILWLAIFREGRNQNFMCQMAIGKSIINRASVRAWWNHNQGGISQTILYPYQYSSFNSYDPNATVWPPDDPTHPEYQAGQICLTAAQRAMDPESEDVTEGATHYHDKSIGFPTGWGEESKWENTIDVDAMKFYKEIGVSYPPFPLFPPPATLDASDN